MQPQHQPFDSDSDIDPGELQQLYSHLLNKQRDKDIGASKSPQRRSRSRSRNASRDKHRQSLPRDLRDQPQSAVEEEKIQIHEYQRCPIELGSIPENIRGLPVYKKHDKILETILSNQVMMVTGDTGCGKSTQIPRILYEYIKASKLEAKILCVQPRRLAVINLDKILSKQIPDQGVVSYQIAMDNSIRPTTKILFMTNGIFLQRFIHSVEQLLKEYPFIILDEIHERDIDTDFILLSMKHILRSNPKLRMILMSATVDNGLFQYYFSEDHISKFLREQNIYMKCLQLEGKKDKKGRNDRSDSEDSEKVRIQESIAMDFMNSKKPCPSITITEQGAYSKQYFYLEDLDVFFERPILIPWANTSFNLKFPFLMKEFVTIGALIVQEIFLNPAKVESDINFSILVFLPGFAEIQMFCNQVEEVVGQQSRFDVIQLHSSTLNSEISSQLNELNPPRPRLIVATNIAESSITVMGVKYVIDFCLSKEVRFNHKTKLENLEMIWTSQASSEQRAGRTGRVCNGVVIRMVEKPFFKELPKYSTPEIQRCSLDRLILRIKLLHENEVRQMIKVAHSVFQDPGQVLGRAIQPPSLKNIDASIKSLMFTGGLELINDQFHLTELGRLYIDLPVDIIYSRMLIMSLIFGTFDDVVILVTLLQQAKNPFKKLGIEKKYMDYWEMMSNESMCDFYGMVQTFRRKYVSKERVPDGIENYSPYEIRVHRKDIEKRLSKLALFRNRVTLKGDEKLRFKMTIWTSFLDNAMRVVLPAHDEKHERRLRYLISRNIPLEKTIVVNSTVIKKHRVYERTDTFIEEWKTSISEVFRLPDEPVDIILDFSESYIIFKKQQNLMKVLFSKNMEESFGRNEAVIKKEQVFESAGDEDIFRENQKHLNFPSFQPRVTSKMDRILNGLGDMEYLQRGEVMDVHSNRKVNVDNFSVNRIISVNPSMNIEYLVTNSKIDKVSGSYCRYTSLLPNQRGLYQLLLMMFYPYLTVRPDEGSNFYNIIKLRKKVKINVGFHLSNKDLEKINKVRDTVRRFLNLSTDFTEEEVKQFWQMLKSIMEVKRVPLIDQKKWQKAFLSEKNIANKMDEEIKDIYETESKYMSPIGICQLRRSYFSFEHLTASEFQCHIDEYNQWKKRILLSLDQIKEYISNTDSHICCRECKIKICKIRSVGAIDRNSFMRPMEPTSGALKEAVFDEMESDFCGMMMSTDVSEYTVHSCQNGHILAIRMGNPLQYRITQFSPIEIMLPDESVEAVDFERLDYRNYTGKTNKALQNKRNLSKALICRVCQEECRSLGEMEKHMKSWIHDEVVKEFKMTMTQ